MRAYGFSTPRRWLGLALGLTLVLLGLAGGASWFFVYRTCQREPVQAASALLLNQWRRFDDVYQVGTAAPPSSAVIPGSVLQQTLMDTQQVEVPGCLVPAKTELLGYMRAVTDAFAAYGGGQPDAVVSALVAESNVHLGEFRRELKEVEACTPWCWPWR